MFTRLKLSFPGDGRSKLPGFTLVEVLATLGIIFLLASLSFTAMSQSRRTARRVACLSNLRQFGIVAQLYAEDNRGIFTGALSDGDDNQNWMYPNYIPSVQVFRCPATRNFVRTDVLTTNIAGTAVLADLLDNAENTEAPGSSYEVFGFMNVFGSSRTLIGSGTESHEVKGLLKTTSTVNSYVHQGKSLGLYGVVPGPSNIWLILDADDHGANEPDPLCNHGSAGANVLFADGHATWVDVKQWTYRYDLSQDEEESF